MTEKVLSSREKRLLIFSTIMRLGHEAFKKNSFNATVLHILNNSRTLMPYDRSALVDIRSGQPKIIGIMGHSQVNQDSEYCVQLKKVLKGFKHLREPVVICDDTFTRYNIPQKTIDNYHEAFSAEQLYILPLQCPDNGENDAFLWVVEFLEETMPKNDKILDYFTLLSSHYAEAIWYKLKTSSKTGYHIAFPRFLKSIFSAKGIFLAILLLFVVSLFYVKVPLQAIADFEFKPTNSHITYSPCGGMISKVNSEAGQTVKKEDIILEYNTKELLYDLSIAQKRLAEILAELDLAKTQSFNNIEYRGKIKILDIKRQLEENRIKKFQWFLERSKIPANFDGTLVIADANILRGKKVEAGEKVFEVISEDDIYAEVYLNEKDAIVLGDKLQIVLYPHNKPEKPIQASILSISPVPLKLDKRQFTYRIKVKPTQLDDEFNCGMRGIANLASQKVTLGYYLFRSLIIWWRKL